MSTTIIPGDAAGLWSVQPVTLACAQKLVRDHTVTSAVGHQSTAEVMAELLGVPVEQNRLTVKPQEGDAFLCFKLKERPPEGAILDRATLEQLGFDWVLLTYDQAVDPKPVDGVRLGDWEEFVDGNLWSVT